MTYLPLLLLILNYFLFSNLWFQSLHRMMICFLLLANLKKLKQCLFILMIRFVHFVASLSYFIGLLCLILYFIISQTQNVLKIGHSLILSWSKTKSDVNLRLDLSLSSRYFESQNSFFLP